MAFPSVIKVLHIALTLADYFAEYKSLTAMCVLYYPDVRTSQDHTRIIKFVEVHFMHLIC